MNTRTSLVLAFLAAFLFFGGCATAHQHPNATIQRQCPAPAPIQARTSPSPDWNRPISIPEINCGDRSQTFVVEYWEDFNPSRGDQVMFLERVARERGFSLEGRSVGQVAALVVAQAIVDDEWFHPSIRLQRNLVDEFSTWSPPIGWWQRMGLLLQIRVRVPNVFWSRVCGHEEIRREHRPATRFQRTPEDEYEFLTMRIERPNNPLDVSIRPSILPPETAVQHRVSVTRAVMRFATYIPERGRPSPLVEWLGYHQLSLWWTSRDRPPIE